MNKLWVISNWDSRSPLALPELDKPFSVLIIQRGSPAISFCLSRSHSNGTSSMRPFPTPPGRTNVPSTFLPSHFACCYGALYSRAIVCVCSSVGRGIFSPHCASEATEDLTTAQMPRAHPQRLGFFGSVVRPCRGLARPRDHKTKVHRDNQPLKASCELY